MLNRFLSKELEKEDRYSELVRLKLNFGASVGDSISTEESEEELRERSNFHDP